MKRKGIAALLFVTLAPALASTDYVSLGILEDVPGVYAGESNTFKVRALFTRTAAGGTAFRSNCAVAECLTTITAEYPKEMTWFVGFDGRQIGQVATRTPKDFGFYGHVGLQDIIDGKAPTVGKASYDYAGFAGGEVHRPLIASSKRNFKDPAVWKRAKVTGELRNQAASLLSTLAPAICIEDASKEDAPLVPFDYSPKQVTVRAYRSKNGRTLITANAEGGYYCDGGDGDGAFDAHTFAVDAQGKSRLLGAGLVLVDAGDYDLDGKSELVFALSLYNRGGYALVTDDFKEQARFEFGYH